MVETEIDASNTWFLQKLADGETAAAATAYEEHAVLLPPVGEAITGRKAIEIFWQSGIEIGVQAVELEPLERRQAARVVCEIGRYRFVLQRAEDQLTLEQTPISPFAGTARTARGCDSSTRSTASRHRRRRARG